MSGKERILHFEINGSVSGENLIRENKISLQAEHGVIKQFLYGVLEEVLKNLVELDLKNVCSENNKLN